MDLEKQIIKGLSQIKVETENIRTGSAVYQSSHEKAKGDRLKMDDSFAQSLQNELDNERHSHDESSEMGEPPR